MSAQAGVDPPEAGYLRLQGRVHLQGQALISNEHRCLRVYLGACNPWVLYRLRAIHSHIEERPSYYGQRDRLKS